jgi:hypothetical protein
MPNELITKNNINITPLIESLVELVKDKDATGELEDFQNCKLPTKDSPDWKLISGVLCNSVVEWASINKDKEVNSLDIVKHLQSDIGYILKRLGLS